MQRSLGLRSLAFTFAACVAMSAVAAAADRKADDVIKDIKAVEMPKLDPAKRNDRAAVTAFIKARTDAMVKKGDLIGELYKVDPQNAELVTLLPERWQALGATKGEEARKEIESVIAKTKDEKLRTEAAFSRARLDFAAAREKPEMLSKIADDFIKIAPKDDRGAMILYSVGMQIEDETKQTEIFKRVVKDYPESQVAGMVKGNLKRMDSIGKPFELEFTDAIKGSTVSMKALKGKVVVIDFWATWCGPCVAEMPEMKKLYASFKPQGVEFIGVSLDQPKEQGGLDALKKYVADNEIAWPQYYQGKGWQSEFSGSWGINSIPAMFVVDAQGKLSSVSARGKLDTILPELLKKGKADAGAGAGAGGN